MLGFDYKISSGWGWMKRCALILLFVSLWLANSFAADQDKRVIQKYVSRTKNWKPSVYRIEDKGREGPYAVYWVIYLPEGRRSKLVAGGGESFAVYYDRRRHAVVREMHFQ
jgi:hypothetical protein